MLHPGLCPNLFTIQDKYQLVTYMHCIPQGQYNWFHDTCNVQYFLIHNVTLISLLLFTYYKIIKSAFIIEDLKFKIHAVSCKKNF